MASRSYLKILAAVVIAPQLVALLLWLGGFDAIYVRAAFKISALGLAIVFASVTLFGFIEMFGQYGHVDARTTTRGISIIYVWSSALPFGISFLTLSLSKALKPSFQAANALDVVGFMLGTSLALHALTLMAILLFQSRGRSKAPPDAP